MIIKRPNIVVIEEYEYMIKAEDRRGKDSKDKAACAYKGENSHSSVEGDAAGRKEIGKTPALQGYTDCSASGR
jgi:hypothetical protein